MTYGNYLRRRKTYSDGGLALREVMPRMPAQLQTRTEVQGWLQQHGSMAAWSEALHAEHGWREALRKWRKTAGATD